MFGGHSMHSSAHIAWKVFTAAGAIAGTGFMFEQLAADMSGNRMRTSHVASDTYMSFGISNAMLQGLLLALQLLPLQ